MNRLFFYGRNLAPFPFPFLVLLLLLLLSLPAAAQIAPSGSQGEMGPAGSGTLVVTVRGTPGTPLQGLVTVEVFTQSRQRVATATVTGASARFPDLILGTYIVEASCPGYGTAREEAELRMKNDMEQVFLVLHPSAGANPSKSPAGQPLLAPKVQAQLNKGLEELRSQRFDAARKNLQSAQKVAPDSPDVNYLLGLLASLTGNPAEAHIDWEKALSFDANHYFSLQALGEEALGKGNLDQAKSLLQRAVGVNPNAWRDHELLAHIYLQQAQFEDAQKSAERAIELGKAEANSAQLVLAKALIAEHDKARAISALQTFLAGAKTDAQAASAQKLLDGLNKPDPPSNIAQPAAAANPETAKASSLPASQLLPPPATWIPPSVDDFVPPVDKRVSCNLPAVLDGVEKRVLEFVKSLDSFAATELLQHQIVNKQGLAMSSEERRYNYLVSIKEVRPGVLDVEEYRNATLALDVFPDRMATLGLPSVILIFHPVNVDAYNFSCEGLGTWHGVPAWQIHFQQKDDRRDLVRKYAIGGKFYPVPLKGRAWISADSLQMVRIETDLREPQPEIKLYAEHQAIDYGPVRFKNQNVTLWLPASTDFYLDFRGRRIHRRHMFDNFLLFSVEDKQKISKPKTEAPPDS